MGKIKLECSLKKNEHILLLARDIENAWREGQASHCQPAIW